MACPLSVVPVSGPGRIGLLAVLALLLPVLVPLLHRPALAVGFNPAALHICSAAGKHGPAAPDSQHKNTDGKPACPLCHSLQLAGHGLAPAATAVFIRLPPLAAALVKPAGLAVVAVYRPPPAAQPRAPPILA